MIIIMRIGCVGVYDVYVTEAQGKDQSVWPANHTFHSHCIRKYAHTQYMYIVCNIL